MANSSDFETRRRSRRGFVQNYFVVGLTLAGVFDLAGCSLLSGISDVPNSPDNGAGQGGERSAGGVRGGNKSGGSDNGTGVGSSRTSGGGPAASSTGGRQDRTTGGVSNAGGHIAVVSEGGEGGERPEGGQGGDGAGGSPIDAPPALSIEEQRSHGLLTLDVPDCVATLVSSDAALVLSTCLDFSDPHQNRFLMPRNDGGIDMREGRVISELSLSGVSLVTLAPALEGHTWPAIARPVISTGDMPDIIGEPVRCAVWAPRGQTGVDWHLVDLDVTGADAEGYIELQTTVDSSLFATSLFGSPCSRGLTLVGLGVCSGGDEPCGSLSPGKPLYLTRLDKSQTYIDAVSEKARDLAQFEQPHYFVRPGSPPVQVWTPYNAWNIQAPGVAYLGSRCAFRGAVQNTSKSLENRAFWLDPDCQPQAGRVLLPLDTFLRSRAELEVSSDGVVELWGDATDAQSFSSLEGLVFLTASATTTPLQVVDGWERKPDGTREPAFAQIDDLVYFQGALRGTGSLAFTLPRELSPKRTVELDIARSPKVRRLVIDPSGEARIVPPLSTAELVSFEGKWFSLGESGWTDLNLYFDNAPTEYFDPPQARFHDGLVEFRGHLTTGESFDYPFYLPTKLTPSGYLWLPLTGCSQNALSLLVSVWGPATLDRQDPYSDFQGCILSLDGLAFGL